MSKRYNRVICLGEVEKWGLGEFIIHTIKGENPKVLSKAPPRKGTKTGLLGGLEVHEFKLKC